MGTTALPCCGGAGMFDPLCSCEVFAPMNSEIGSCEVFAPMNADCGPTLEDGDHGVALLWWSWDVRSALQLRSICADEFRLRPDAGKAGVAAGCVVEIGRA